MNKTEVSQRIVDAVNEAPIVNSLDWSRKQTPEIPHDLVVGCLKSLMANDILVMSQTSVKVTSITPKGEVIAQKGSPGYILWSSLPEDGESTKQDLEKAFGSDFRTAMGDAMKSKWVSLRKDGESQFFKRNAKDVVDTLQVLASKLIAGEELVPKDMTLLTKQKIAKIDSQVTVWKVEKGRSFSTDKWDMKPETELTQEMLTGDAWKNLTFKAYNFNALGIEPIGGHLHPLLKVRSEFREIFLELGYTEMPTSNFVESSFWNFDALFQPQSHPARDAHDTFFLADPANTLTIPEDYMQRVKEMHQTGGNGSHGWRYEWDEVEARKNILRTHTTAVSSRMLYALAQQEVFTPRKYFSIDRVYRNETLDATHLAEFHQIEGLIADYDLTLANLIGAIKQFFARVGITDLKFKPAYNPYTEPSMEIFGYHPTLKKWVEVGNSGMFRPEMLEPMGLPEGVRVIAWGLSVERPTMIKYSIANIRDLFGHRVDIPFIKRSPIARFAPKKVDV